MLALDKPYVSDFLLQCAQDHGVPVLDTKAARQLAKGRRLNYVAPDATTDGGAVLSETRLLTVSENALSTIIKMDPASELVAQIDLFKDKLAFREKTASLHPDITFRALALEEIGSVDPGTFPFPCVIKPSIGFFSMGVHPLFGADAWDHAVGRIRAEMEAARKIYPPSVIDSTTFIVEQMIEGDEFAVDGYFDAEGRAVILGIFKHLFASGDDVSDRVYLTSKEIIEDCLAEFTAYLDELGALTGCCNFPFHAELRRDGTGQLRPIEVNPLRFGGWCSTADLTAQAFGLNPYLAWFNAEIPDWPTILKGHCGDIFALVVLDNSTGVDTKEIRDFDLDAVCARFDHVIEARRIDFRSYPVFGFLMVRTPSADISELEAILASDLRDYVIL